MHCVLYILLSMAKTQVCRRCRIKKATKQVVGLCVAFEDGEYGEGGEDGEDERSMEL